MAVGCAVSPTSRRTCTNCFFATKATRPGCIADAWHATTDHSPCSNLGSSLLCAAGGSADNTEASKLSVVSGSGLPLCLPFPLDAMC
eukprot:4321740-Amphidinium_carterae.1